MRTKSYARVKNAAKVDANGFHPRTCIPTAAATICCSAMYISKKRSGMRLRELLGVGRVRDLAVERDDVAARAAERQQRVAVRLARRDLLARARSVGSSSAPRLEHVRLAAPSGLWTSTTMLPLAAELRDRALRIVERLAVPAVLVLDRLHALALHRARDDRSRPAARRRAPPRTRGRSPRRRGRRSRSPPSRTPRARAVYEERSQPCIVSPRWPSRLMSRIADEVVELRVRRVLERLPHRSLGHLAVAADAPHAIRQPVELLAGERHADRDRQALPERAGRDVDPRDHRRRVPLEPRAELAEGQQLLVGDRAGGLEDGVDERRRVALREDQVVVPRVVRVVEVVAEVLREEHGHQVGRGHRGRRVARTWAPPRRGPSRRGAAVPARARARDRLMPVSLRTREG